MRPLSYEASGCSRPTGPVSISSPALCSVSACPRPLRYASSSGSSNRGCVAPAWAQQPLSQMAAAIQSGKGQRAVRAAAAAGGSQGSASKPTSTQVPLISFAEVEKAAKSRGMNITVKELGPFYRIVCREGTDPAVEGKILAVTTGFVVPLFGLMHCDTLQVFTKGMKGEEGQRIRGGVLGLGLLMGGATFSYGLSKGCKKAEILAINDDDSWHERLVKYYSFFGFEPVMRVEGSSLSDLPHMLVWGGAGTRMDADIPRMLAKWTPSLRRAAAAPASTPASAAASSAGTEASAGAGPGQGNGVP